MLPLSCLTCPVCNELISTRVEDRPRSDNPSRGGNLGPNSCPFVSSQPRGAKRPSQPSSGPGKGAKNARPTEGEMDATPGSTRCRKLINGNLFERESWNTTFFLNTCSAYQLGTRRRENGSCPMCLGCVLCTSYLCPAGTVGKRGTFGMRRHPRMSP